MSADPVVRLAKLRIIKASADLEVQLSTKSGSAPTLEILRRLKERAADSLAALAFVDAESPVEIRNLQNEVKRYDEWVIWIREVIAEGIVANKEMTDEDRDEMLDILVATPEGQQEAILLGLVDQDMNDA